MSYTGLSLFMVFCAAGSLGVKGRAPCGRRAEPARRRHLNTSVPAGTGWSVGRWRAGLCQLWWRSWRARYLWRLLRVSHLARFFGTCLFQHFLFRASDISKNQIAESKFPKNELVLDYSWIFWNNLVYSNPQIKDPTVPKKRESCYLQFVNVFSTYFP